MELIRFGAFMQHLFDRALVAEQAAQIVAGILAARSPQLSQVAQHMPGTLAANYKALQRFMANTDLQAALRRLFQADWVMSSLPPRTALRIYHARMKIDESFKDLKNLLGLDKVMNRFQQHMEQMATLTMIAYAVGLRVGQTLRDALYPPPPPTDDQAADPAAPSTTPSARRCKWQLYSGPFSLLKQKLSLLAERLGQLIDQALQTFAALVFPLVPA